MVKDQLSYADCGIRKDNWENEEQDQIVTWEL